MYRWLLTGTAAIAIVTTMSLIENCAAAMPLGGPAGVPLALEQTSPIEEVALCFYLDGWNGPGLYQCGFRRRVGLGFVSRERERRERFEERRERRERFENRERRERFEDRERRR